jgi:predicted dehydrogenase
VSGKGLHAVVIGAGWAGQGHTLALRHNDVHVQAICARDRDTIEAVAARLEIPEASVDWRATVQDVRPDIVSIATPASLRREVVEMAAELGCHIFCEKPLAPNGPAAKELFEIVDHTGIVHTYASTLRYDPSIAWMAELVHGGAIGELREIDWAIRFPQPSPPLLPWTWGDKIAAGGGLLNGILTHVLGILERVTGGALLRAMGEARTLRHRAPVVPGVHDSRQTLAKVPTPEQAADLEWRECDAENAASMLLRFSSPTPDGPEIQVTGILSAFAPAVWPPNGMRLYGEEGTLVATGAQSFRVTRRRPPSAEPEPMPVPQRLIDAHPQIEDPIQARWAALARDFVADIQSQPHQPYLTFGHGWRYQEAIDAIRSGEGWRELPTLTP